MMRQCRFIKPLLLRAPPDPTSFKPRDIQELLFLGKHFHKLGEARMYDTLRFCTMSCADFLDEYFESEIVKAHLRRQLDHRHRARAALAGHGLRAAAPLHGRHRRRGRRLGLRARRHGRDHAGARPPRFEASGGTIRASAPVEQILVRDGRATGVVLDGRRGDLRAGSSSRTSTSSAPS